MSRPMPKTDTSQILSRGLEALRVLATERGPVGVRELARRLGCSSSAAQRLLNGLVASGFAVKETTTPRYRASISVLELARGYLDSEWLGDEMQEILQQASDTTGETAALFVRDWTDRVCIAVARGRLQPSDAIKVGSRRPIQRGAGGKLLMAHMAPSERRALLDKTSPPGLASGALTRETTVISELERIQAEGYAISHGERAQGLSAVAAPVIDATGRVTGAVTLSGPSSRFTQEALPGYLQVVTDAARRLSETCRHVRLAYDQIDL